MVKHFYLSEKNDSIKKIKLNSSNKFFTIRKNLLNIKKDKRHGTKLKYPFAGFSLQGEFLSQ